jgi:hypothetical protein
LRLQKIHKNFTIFSLVVNGRGSITLLGSAGGAARVIYQIACLVTLYLSPIAIAATHKDNRRKQDTNLIFQITRGEKMRILAILLAAAIVYANPALARNGGGKHEGHQTGGGAEHGNPGGMASEHMGQHGMENSNAQWTTDGRRGQDRADWRHQDERGNGHGAGDGDHAGKGKYQGHHDHGGSDKGKKDKSNKGHKGHSNHGNHNNHSGHKGHGKGADY